MSRSMRLWQDDVLSRFRSASSEEDLFEAIKAEARKIGFEYCALVLQLHVHLTNPKTIVFTNYPSAWKARDVAHNYLATGPVARHGISPRPIVWSDDVFKDSPEFWEDARSHGLRYGWTQASADSRGIRGTFTLARSNEPLSEAELRDKGYQMVWLTQAAHECMGSRVSSRLLPETSVQLSEPEIAVLKWTADGKTSGEVSDILNIPERTVNFHVSKAMHKLNCANKTATTVRAALLGLLT